MYIPKTKKKQILSVFEASSSPIPVNSFSLDELRTIENFASLILNKVDETKNRIIDFFKNVESINEVKDIAQGIEDRWTTLHVLLSDKSLREDVLKSQKTSSEKILFPGIGAAYIQKGIISQIIADTKVGLSCINLYVPRENKDKIKTLCNQIDELYAVLMPRPQV